MTDLVPVAPLREAFEESGMTTGQVAQRLGWFRAHDGFPDRSRFLRAIGVYHSYKGGARRRYFRVNTSYVTAVAIAEALGLDPVDVGL